MKETKENQENQNKETTKNETLKGEVVVYFKVGKKEYFPGKTYETKCQKSFDILKSKNRIK